MVNKTKMLVTAEIPSTWPTDGEKILFLADWCKPYSRKTDLEKLDHETLPYPWDDRKQLEKDSEYLELLHERILQRVSKDLNKIHDVSYPLLYWRILVSPWLMSFLGLALEKWRLLEAVPYRYNSCSYKSLTFEHGDLIAESYKEFDTLATGANWSQKLTQDLLSGTNWGFIELPSSEIIPISKVRQPSLHPIKKLINVLSTKIFRRSGVAVVTNTLGLKNYLKIQIGLGQLPSLWFRMEVPNSEYDPKQRNLFKSSIKSADEFEKKISQILPNYIPKSYVEGYSTIKALSGETFPQSARCILDTNSWNSDDLIKFWIADQVCKGAKLYIFQHGGYYGAGKIRSTEAHELKIAHYFLSWGWTEKNNEKIIPVGMLRGRYFDRAAKAKRSEKKFITLIQGDGPKYATNLLSAPISAKQWAAYLSDQFKFVDSLGDIMRESLLIRLIRSDFSETKVQWADRFPDLNYDDGQGDIAKVMKQTKLNIVTYNATGLLESLYLNLPTIAFWNPNHWELRANAEPYYQALSGAKILHYTPESAAAHAKNIWMDIDAWWLDDSTQNARKAFCEVFARDSSNAIKRLISVIRSD
jgi:putative transferase (TIGR04331 family)